MLGEQVGWVALTKHFPQLKAPGTHRLLDPKGMRVQVSEFPQTLPAAYPDGSGRVCPDSQRHVEPHVLQQGLEAQTLPGPTHHSVVLCFTGAQGHTWLGGAPVFHGVPTEHHAATEVDLRVRGQPAQSVSV